MHGLVIEAAMVNPHGKIDGLNQPVPAETLNREWVQIRNATGTAVALDRIELMHFVYTAGAEPKESLIMQLRGTLPAQAALRIHSGKGTPGYDSERHIYHSYASSKSSHYLFQIVKPDRLILRRGRQLIDMASYVVPVPEGRRLKRVLPLERRLLQPL